MIPENYLLSAVVLAELLAVAPDDAERKAHKYTHLFAVRLGQARLGKSLMNST